MPIRFDNRVAIVTGAGAGLGRSHAMLLASRGAKVVVNDPGGAVDGRGGEHAVADKVVAEIRAGGGEAVANYNSVADAASAQAIVDTAMNTWGRLDILVNNAGVSKEGFGPNQTSTTSAETLRETFETNFFGTVALTQKLLPLLRKSPAGRIVNLSSILGSLTLHADPQSPIYSAKAFAYDASKTALNAFTVHLAHELRETKIKVNSAHPGWVKTDMGTDAAPMEIPDGAKTSVRLATLPDDGPTGGYFHMDKTLPW